MNLRGSAFPDGLLVATGMIRSGTTFVGRVLDSDPETGIAMEPWSPFNGLDGMAEWFPIVNSQNEQIYRRSLQDILEGRARFMRSIARRRSEGPIHYATKLVGRRVFRSRSQLEYYRAALDPRIRRIVVKDPNCLISIDWMVREFGARAVISVRHPCAFVASMQRVGWDFDPAPFMRPVAKERFPEAYELGCRAGSAEPYSTERLALAWSAAASVTLDMAGLEGVLVVTHEEICADPLTRFGVVFEHLGMDLQAGTERRIKAMTEAEDVVPDASVVHSLKRNSRALAESWRSSLSPSEIKTILHLAGSYASNWYAINLDNPA